jgi:diguanylate cyclase (GGDEF)-like protein
MKNKKTMSESEKLIRRLYEITTQQEGGISSQIKKLLALGCERFNLDIGILSKISQNNYHIEQVYCPEEVGLKTGDCFELDKTYCEVTLKADGPTGFEHVKHSKINQHPAYEAFKLESYIGIVIKVNGEVFGTLNFSSPEPLDRTFSPVDIDALQIMALWVSYSLSHLHTTSLLEKSNEKLRKLSITDPLTNLLNRRAFQKFFEKQILLTQRNFNMPSISLIMIDIDFFKKINDKYGHIEGDDILINFSNILLTSRASDLVARFGGEEFVIALLNTTKEGALKKAENLRITINDFAWPNEKVTASFGVATYITNSHDTSSTHQIIEGLFKQADQALYYSKGIGRNQVTHIDDMPNKVPRS